MVNIVVVCHAVLVVQIQYPFVLCQLICKKFGFKRYCIGIGYCNQIYFQQLYSNLYIYFRKKFGFYIHTISTKIVYILLRVKVNLRTFRVKTFWCFPDCFQFDKPPHLYHRTLPPDRIYLLCSCGGRWCTKYF